MTDLRINRLFIGIILCTISVLVSAQELKLTIDSTDERLPIICLEILDTDSSSVSQFEAEPAQILSLHLNTAKGTALIPVSGKYQKNSGRLFFQPLYPLGQGLDFIISTNWGNRNLRRIYRTPAYVPVSGASPRVLQVYPMDSVIPENILCFHILFDQPMYKDRQAFLHAKILLEGEELPLPWKHTTYWSQGGRLMVLMIHPGKVKRGIDYPGIDFEIGKRYSLVLAPEVYSTTGQKVEDGIRRDFIIAKADRRSPKVKKSCISLPDKNSEPIVLKFKEPMDYGCMVEGILLLDKMGEALPISVNPINDQVFEITSDKPWHPGSYQLVLKHFVGDLSGNRIGQEFEVKKLPTYEELKTDRVFTFNIK